MLLRADFGQDGIRRDAWGEKNDMAKVAVRRAVPKADQDAPKRKKKAVAKDKNAATKRKKTSSKGALVKGVSAKLPIDLLDEPTFKHGLQEITRGYSGLYFLYKRNTLYYIGLAKNLYWRLVSHSKNKHKGHWDSFAIFRVGRVRYLKDIESLLLRAARPPGNSVSGNFHRDANLTKVLKGIRAEQMRRLKRIGKVLK